MVEQNPLFPVICDFNFPVDLSTTESVFLHPHEWIPRDKFENNPRPPINSEVELPSLLPNQQDEQVSEEVVAEESPESGQDGNQSSDERLTSKYFANGSLIKFEFQHDISTIRGLRCNNVIVDYE